MRFLVFAILPFFLLLSCSSSKEDAYKEMRKMEYARNINHGKFVHLLNSKDADIRLRAVETLGRVQDSTTIVLVANQLSDEDFRIREAAAFALGQFPSRNIEQLIEDGMRYETNDSVRLQSLEALGKVGTDKSYLRFTDYLQDTKSDFVKAAAVACGISAYRGYPPFSAVNSLVAQLKMSTEPDVRWRCAYALYRIGSPAALAELYQALDKADPMTRFFDLKALNAIVGLMQSHQFDKYRNTESARKIQVAAQSPEFVNALEETMQDSAWYVRYADLKLMGTLAYPTLWHTVEQGLKDRQAHVREAALEAAANYHNSASEVLLTDFIIGTDNWREKGIALGSLAEIDSMKVLDIIKKSIDGSSWPENYYLIKVLQEIDSPASTNLLIKMAEVPNMAQVSLVFEGLVNQSTVPLGLLIEKLQLNDPAVTTIIASKLALVKDTTTVPALISTYKKLHAPVDIEPMQQILVALDSINSRKAVPLLEQELANPFPLIHNSAREALKHITSQDYQLPAVANQSMTRWNFPSVDPKSRPKIKFTTTKGDFVIVLYPDKAPVTVANFIQLVNSEFYNDIYFHRVIPGFVIQGGDPRGDGWGGPGYTIPCEYNDIFYDRGVVGVAHAGKDTGGSQFFITQTPQPHLNGKHTAFGRVISGMKVVDKIQIFDKILKAELIK